MSSSRIGSTRIVLLALAIAGAAAAPTDSRAQAAGNSDVEIRTSISPALISVGEEADYKIVVTGAVALQEKPTVRLPDGLEVVGSTNLGGLTIINGTRMFNRTLTYSVTADAAGDYEIPAQIINIGGERLVSEPVSLQVNEARVRNSSQGGGSKDTWIVGS